MSSSSDRVVQELLLLQRVVQRINSILDLEALLEEIVDDVAQTFGYSRTAILLLDEQQPEDLVIATVRGWTRFHEKGHRFKVGKEGMVGHVASTGTMRYAPDVRADPYYCVSEDETRSEVDIPLNTKGRLIGVFNAQHTEVDGFPPNQLQLLEVLAGHVSTAIENARLLRVSRWQGCACRAVRSAATGTITSVCRRAGSASSSRMSRTRGWAPPFSCPRPEACSA